MAKHATIPSMLNFMRSINPSLGLMYAQNASGRVPIEVRDTTVRGVIGDYKDGHLGKNTEGQDANSKALDNPNIQTIDTAFLPPGYPSLSIDYTLSFLPHSLAPDACNDTEYRGQIEAFAARYRDLNGYAELARLYLWNIANGRTLWRNRFGDQKTVTVTLNGEKTFDFDSGLISMASADGFPANDSSRPLIDAMAGALAGKTPTLTLAVTSSVRLGDGQEVYPSQEFIQSSKRAKQPGDKSKTLAGIPHGSVKRHAIMHSQKIGNAIRTIDAWHSQAKDYGPIAVEPYGVAQKRFAVLRTVASKSDLFSHLERLDGLMEKMAEGSIPADAHYVMACLVRGGVYSGEGKKTKKAKKAKEPVS